MPYTYFPATSFPYTEHIYHTVVKSTTIITISSLAYVSKKKGSNALWSQWKETTVNTYLWIKLIISCHPIYREFSVMVSTVTLQICCSPTASPRCLPPLPFSYVRILLRSRLIWQTPSHWMLEITSTETLWGNRIGILVVWKGDGAIGTQSHGGCGLVVAAACNPTCCQPSRS